MNRRAKYRVELCRDEGCPGAGAWVIFERSSWFKRNVFGYQPWVRTGDHYAYWQSAFTEAFAWCYSDRNGLSDIAPIHVCDPERVDSHIGFGKRP
jgi:hypothetical protein